MDSITPLKPFGSKYSNLTKAQDEAFNHAVARHGKELTDLIGKPIQWGKKNTLQSVLDNFNEAVNLIYRKGSIVGQKNVSFQIKGSGKNSS